LMEHRAVRLRNLIHFPVDRMNEKCELIQIQTN
jgi:hypothetical protein